MIRTEDADLGTKLQTESFRFRGVALFEISAFMVYRFAFRIVSLMPNWQLSTTFHLRSDFLAAYIIEQN